jgi:hypothetical protein
MLIAITLPSIYLIFAITIAIQVHSVDSNVGASTSSSGTSSNRKKEIQVDLCNKLIIHSPPIDL